MDFHRNHQGENLRRIDDRDKPTIAWQHTYSGVLVFSNRCLRKEEKVWVESIGGSGHVRIGIIQTDPSQLSEQLLSTDDIPDFKNLTDIRGHNEKWKLTISMSRASDDVTATVQNNMSHVSAFPSRGVWIVIYIKFGNIQLVLGSEESRKGKTISVNSRHGPNVQIEKNQFTSVCAIIENPAAVCLLDTSMHVGDKLKLACCHQEHQPPSSYHLVIGGTHLPPNVVRTKDPQSFSLRAASTKGSHLWFPVLKFDKKSGIMNREIEIEIVSYREIHVTFPDGKKCRGDIQRLNKDGELWLVLELFRLSVSIISFTKHVDETYITPVETYITPRTDNTSADCADGGYIEFDSQPEGQRPSEESRDKSISFTKPMDMMDETYLTPKTDNTSVDCADGGCLEYDNRPEGKSESCECRRHHKDTDNRLTSLERSVQNMQASKQEHGRTTGSTERQKRQSAKAEYIKRAMRDNYGALVEDLDAPVLCDYLYQYKVITFEEKREIQGSEIRKDRNRRIIDILMQRNVAEDSLWKAFKYACHDELFNKLFTITEKE